MQSKRIITKKKHNMIADYRSRSGKAGEKKGEFQ
jgi:hypothetical protein